MPGQRRLFAALVLCLDGGEVGIQRRLGIDDDFASVGHAHDHIRSYGPTLGGQVLLFIEVAVLHHAGQFRQPLQRHLPPLPTYLRSAQGLHQVSGLGLQQLLCLGHGFQMLGEGTVGLTAVLLQFMQLLFRFFQRFSDRLDQAFDGLFSLGELRGTHLVELLEFLIGQFEEGIGVVAQGLLRQLGELLIELILDLQQGIGVALLFKFQL